MKELERKFSKTERVIAKAKYSHWTFAREIMIAAVLGGLIAVVWIFALKIEGFFTKADTLKYLTDQNMKWALLAAAGLVALLFLFHAISYYKRETVLTETHLVSKHGILSANSFMVPVVEIKMVESEQNILQRLLNLGNIIVVSDAEKPYKIKSVVAPEKFARRVMKQAGAARVGDKSSNVSLSLAGNTQLGRVR